MEFTLFRVLQRLALLSLLLIPVKTWSLGLGDVTVESLLDYPLRAKLKLLAVRAGELATLNAKLASDRDFDWIGIKRPEILQQLEFSGPVSDGKSFYVAITTKEPIREPVLNFLVEAHWAAGRLLREYTIKLQPADIATVRQSQKHSKSPSWQPSQVEPTSEGDDIAPPPSSTKSAVDDGDVTEETANQSNYRSVPGDTLSDIAKIFLPDNLEDNPVNRFRMMIALLEANPHAFINNNINGLKSNAELLIPAAGQVRRRTKEQVVAEVRRQNDLWRNKSSGGTADAAGIQDEPIDNPRKGVDAAPSPESDVPQKSVEAGKPKQLEASKNAFENEKLEAQTKPTQQDAGAVGQSEDHGRLTIISAQEPLEETGILTVASAEYIANLERSVTLAQELAESRRREAEEIMSRVGRLESVIAQQERLIKLQNDQMSEFNERIRKLSQLQKPPPANHEPWLIGSVIVAFALVLLYRFSRFIKHKKTPANG